MQNLKLHSSGRENYLNAVMDEFRQLVIKIKSASNRTAAEKEAELKKAKEEFDKKMKDSRASFF